MSRSHSNYLPTLDGWRAIAISLVLIAHVSRIDVGGFGVQIFFGLSGFLITSLLLRQEARLGSISLGAFYTRRAFRILPAACFYLTTIGILTLLGVISVSFWDWMSALLFMASYAQTEPSWYVLHFWSLAVEEHFYLIWPAVLIIARGNRKRLMLAVTIAILIGIWRLADFRFRWFWPDSAFLWSRRTDIQADNIIFGVAFALALVDERIAPRLQAFLRRSSTTFVAIAVFATTCLLSPRANWEIGLLLQSIRGAIVPIMILSTMHNPTGIIGRTLELRPARFVGLISYSLYLWQELFLASPPSPQLAVVQWFPVNVGIAFVCAALSFYFVEIPLIRRGHELSARWALPRQANVRAIETS